MNMRQRLSISGLYGHQVLFGELQHGTNHHGQGALYGANHHGQGALHGISHNGQGAVHGLNHHGQGALHVPNVGHGSDKYVRRNNSTCSAVSTATCESSGPR